MPEIPSYPTLTAVAVNDEFVIVDVSDTSASSLGTVKKTTPASVLGVACYLFPSGDTSGAGDATAINSAVTALSGGPGLIVLTPSAPWYVECGQVVINQSGLYLDATGCTINATGAGDMIDMHDTSTFETRTVHGGGVIGYPHIDGTLTTGNSAALHTGDIFQLRTEVHAWNFTAGTTSKGVWYDNRWWIAEQAYGRIFTTNCTAGVVFDVNSGATATGAHVNATGSYERSILDLNVNQVGPANDGVVWQNGAFLQDGVLNFHGNFGTSASPLTSAALRINGATPSGITQPTNSNITNSVLNIGCEVDASGGNTDAPFTINFGTGNNFIGQCSGNIDFGAADAFQSSNNGGQFAGYVGVVAGDDNLPASLPSGSTNIADSAQTVNSLTAAAVTSVSAPVAAFTAYRVRIFVPYSSTHAAGTPVFAFTGPSFALACFNWWFQTAATPWTTVKTVSTSAPTMTGPTLSTGANLALVGEGVIAFGSAGAVGLSAATTASTANTFVIGLGAYIETLLLSSP